MANTVKLQGISGQQAGTQAKDVSLPCVLVWIYGAFLRLVAVCFTVVVCQFRAAQLRSL